MTVKIIRQYPNLVLATLIASSGFVQPVSPELQADVDAHLHEGQMLYSIVSRGETVGFAIFKMFDPEILYLGGIILREDHQGKGIALQVVETAQQQTGALWLGLRTQSPRMWTSATRMVRRIWPHPNDADSSCLFTAQALARRLGMEAIICKGFYGGPLYGRKPVHPNGEIQNWWNLICDFERGDAVVVAGRF